MTTIHAQRIGRNLAAARHRARSAFPAGIGRRQLRRLT